MRRKVEEVKEVQAIVHRIDPTDVLGALCRITQVQQTLAEKEAAALAARRALDVCERRTWERLQPYSALLAEFDAELAAQQARFADFHARATRLETLRTYLQTGGSK
jgi:hypothetical protein